VRLAIIPEFGSHWLAAHLPAFRARYPGVDLQILVGTRPLDLSRGEADIAVRSPNPRETGLVASRIAQSTFGLYASTTWWRNRRRRITDADSARGLPFLIYTPPFDMLQNAPWFPPRSPRAPSSSRRTARTPCSPRRGLRRRRCAARLVARGHDDLVPVSDDVTGRTSG
jgi:DNA-binding transcriptional LysR family regulator